MADDVTTVYDFVLPEVGGSDDTWGTKLNANFAKLETLFASVFEEGSPTAAGKLKTEAWPDDSSIPSASFDGRTIIGGSDSNNNIRMKAAPNTGGYGVIMRSETDKFKLLLTALNDADGANNAFEPLILDKATGVLKVGQGLVFKNQAGVSFGERLAASATALGRHIDLFGGNYGFNITGSSLNSVVPTDSYFSFLFGAAPARWVMDRSSLVYLGGVNGAVSNNNGGAFGNIVSIQASDALANTGTLMEAYYGTSRRFFVKRDGVIDLGALLVNATPAGAVNAAVTAAAKTATPFTLMSGVNTPSMFQFRDVANGLVARIEPDDKTTPQPTTVMTRRKGDARYVLQTGNGAIDGDLSLSGELVLPDPGAIHFFNADNRIQYTGGSFHFVKDAVTAARVEAGGVGVPNVASVLTREKGDNRYSLISSSLRYKEDVDDARPLPNLFEIDTKSWVWGGQLADDDIRRGTPGYGLIAEHVAAVFPEAVRFRGTDPDGLESLPLIGALFAEVKRLRDRVAALEAA